MNWVKHQSFPVSIVKIKMYHTFPNLTEVTGKRIKENQMIINSKKWDTSISIQIAHYNYIKSSSKRQDSFKNCIVRINILVFTLKVCFSEPNSDKDIKIKSFIFLNSTLILKIVLRKLDRTRAKFWQSKIWWSVVSIPAPQEHIGSTVSLKLYLYINAV